MYLKLLQGLEHTGCGWYGGMESELCGIRTRGERRKRVMEAKRPAKWEIKGKERAIQRERETEKGSWRTRVRGEKGIHKEDGENRSPSQHLEHTCCASSPCQAWRGAGVTFKWLYLDSWADDLYAMRLSGLPQEPKRERTTSLWYSPSPGFSFIKKTKIQLFLTLFSLWKHLHDFVTILKQRSDTQLSELRHSAQRCGFHERSVLFRLCSGASSYSSFLSECNSSLSRVSPPKYETEKSDDCETPQVWHCESERTNRALQLFISWDCLFIKLTPGASTMIRLKQRWSSVSSADAASKTQPSDE